MVSTELILSAPLIVRVRLCVLMGEGGGVWLKIHIYGFVQWLLYGIGSNFFIQSFQEWVMIMCIRTN